MESGVLQELRKLNNAIKKCVSKQIQCDDNLEKASLGITELNLRVIDYLLKNDLVVQKDLEEYLSLSKATVSTLLKSMEKKNLILRIQLKDDQRAKRIILTESTIAAHMKFKGKLMQIEKEITSTLTTEEQANLIEIINKINKVLI